MEEAEKKEEKPVEKKLEEEVYEVTKNDYAIGSKTTGEKVCNMLA